MKEKNWGYQTKVIYPNYTIGIKKRTGFSTEEEANKNRKEDQERYEKELQRIKKEIDIQYTFLEYVEYWKENIYYVRSSATKSVLNFAINHLIIPKLERDTFLPFVTKEMLNGIIEENLKVSQSAGWTAKKYLRLLLGDAYLYGYIKKDFRPELIHIPEGKGTMDLPDKEELRKVMRAARNHPEHYLEILLAFLTGIRMGEILGLKYSDFHKGNQTMRIVRQCIRSDEWKEGKAEYQMIEKEPKSNSARTLKIPSIIFEELEKRKKLNKKYLMKNEERKKIEEYVCISCYGKRKTTSTLTPALKRICNEAGVKPFTMHTLRHVFITLLLENGMPLEEVSKCAGHRSIYTTFNTYAGIVEAREQAKEVLEEMDPVRGMML